tara:strand:- start:168 stop:413 length:246 start_codon:yes stop_codon:yes gene_type:complete
MVLGDTWQLARGPRRVAPAILGECLTVTAMSSLAFIQPRKLEIIHLQLGGDASLAHLTPLEAEEAEVGYCIRHRAEDIRER